MRLVTYDRGGARRLGAWVDGTVVDLPDAVGHPSFPATMEDLVEHNGGTILDAARDILIEPGVALEFAVPNPRLLVPLVPHALRDAAGPPAPASPAVLGPDDEVSWPESGGLRVGLEVACVAGRGGRRLVPIEAAEAIFGYTLVCDWSVAHKPKGGAGRNGHDDDHYVAFSMGPCIVTADEFEPSHATIEARVDGKLRSRGTLSHLTETFAQLIAKASRTETVRPGDLYGSGKSHLSRRPERDLHPGAVVEIHVGGLGVLRTSVGHPSRTRS